jgi:tetratricopeptide (TPR) repeat protein
LIESPAREKESGSSRCIAPFFLLVACLWFACFSPLCGKAQATGDPDSKAAVGAISSALRARNYAAAEKLCEAATAAHPEDYRYWTLRGMATSGLGNPRLALSYYQHALKLAPAYLPALEGTAQTAFQLGDASATGALLKILAQRPEDATSNAMLAVLEARSRNCEDAVIHFQKAGTAIAARGEALTEYGACLSILDRAREAVAQFADALALDPARSESRYNLSLAQWKADHSQDALKTLAPLLDDTVAHADALALAAEIHEASNETAVAIDLLRKAILADPRSVDAYLQFAMLSYDHASPKVGIDILNAGLTQLPREPKLYLVRGVLLTQLGEFGKATDDFEAANRIDPQLQFLRTAQGIVQSQEHDAPKALASFRAAVKAHPDEAYAHYLLAEALQSEGKPEGSAESREEIHEAARAIQLEPRMIAAHDLLAASYIEQGHVNEAIEHSRAALAIDPNDQQAIYHLILALRKTEDKSEVPALVNKLMEVQKSSQSRAPDKKKFLLYEPLDQASARDK